MKELIKVNGNQTFMGVEIPVVLGGFGKDKKCISDKTIAEIHNQPAYEIRRRITENLKRFKVNIDFIDLAQRMGQSQTLELLNNLGYSKQAISQAEHIYILSEKGYAKLIKIMDSDLAWEIHDKLIDEYFELREEIKQIRMNEYQKMTIKTREKNAQIKEAQLLERLANQYDGTYKQILHAHATKVLTGDFLLPLPKLEAKTYSATELGQLLGGISSKKVGMLANNYNLKTDEYGISVMDKAKYCNKEVPAFRYFDSVIPVLKDILSQE